MGSEKESDAENCWEFMKCPEEIKKDCPAFETNSGKECWFVASHYCKKFEKDFENCFDCPWFKKFNENFGKLDFDKKEKRI